MNLCCTSETTACLSTTLRSGEVRRPPNIEIRAAAPASPRRLVRQLRSPGDSGEDWVVGHLQVRRDPAGLKEGKVRVEISCTVEPAEAEETRCANCGKVSAKNRACRGCLLSYFCNSECQREGWGDHKAACKLTAVTMNEPGEAVAYEAASKALASAASPAATPTDAQIRARMDRIILKEINRSKEINPPEVKRALSRKQTPEVGFTMESVKNQLAVDLGISLDDRTQWIMDEITKFTDNLPNVIDGIRSVSWSEIPSAGGGRGPAAAASARAGMGAVAGDNV
jgi:hypothetical protein